ncbi:MAG: alkaline phosphatase family protein [Armatimonadota bacterium]|nr:alkaline phosphatase family protein [Armatimonadota bacterium]MDR7465581.1 alkaline phosphatase family protein [Armatimonadota bacterium]MDR7469241.1 alkaline phosphatase family protein [Armatimonadota bacterium]MDR7475048.1 alkaline phosphatase family protein [Armatimonadota bacterium]MDR7538954.1 alkaline phosphatase family protein [Armatimonadota bacterium]
MKKILYVILDGVGDRPIAAMDGQTPLAAARTPHLDQLAREGRLGLVQTVGPGIAPESDVAVLAMLGYDPRAYHTGRGPLEALGAGLLFHDGDLALRGNFATLGAGQRIVDRRVGRNLTSEEAQQLAQAVNSQVRLAAGAASFVLGATVGHRCVVVFYPREGKLSARITNTDPAYARAGGLGVARAVVGTEVEECRALDDSPEAWVAAELVNEFTRKARAVLEEHEVNARRQAAGLLPANGILLRDAGDHLPAVPPLAQRFGARLACLVEMPVERGIARYLGMDIVEIAPGVDYRAWAARALESIAAYDGLYLHLKGPDEPGHDGDWERKRASIEEIDAQFFGPLLASAPGEWLWAVTADHATPCEIRGHSDDAVPLLVAGSGSDGRARFTEAEAARGSLGTLQGTQVLPLLVELAAGPGGRAKATPGDPRG